MEGGVMTKQKLLITGSLIFIFAMTAHLAIPQAAYPQEGTVSLVRIFCQPSPPQEVIVEPDTAYIAPGAVVAWWNKGRMEATVRFLEGEECAVGSSAPTGFRLESQKCYTTSHMPAGGMSSLKFDEEGTYEFEVEFQGVGKGKGKVIVTKRE